MTENTLTKFCSKCNTEKSVSEFSKSKYTIDGMVYCCKNCEKEYKKKYHQKNKEKINKRRLANKEKIREQCKAYHQKNKDVISKRHKEYRIINKDILKEYSKKYKKEYNKTENGKAAYLKSNQKRRAIKRNATVEDFSPVEVFERDGYRCQICGRKTRPDFKNQFHPLYPNLDHLIPLSKGGEHSKLNTQCLCHQCNIEKHNNEHFGDQQRLFG